MKNKYKELVQKLFNFYMNNKRIEHKLSLEEYEYLLYHKLDMIFYDISMNTEKCNPELVKRFQEKKHEIAKRNSCYHSEIDKILLEFNRHDINYTFLKGWACLIELYNTFTDRYFGDIDILIEERDISKVERVLFDIGYKYGIIKQGVIVEPERGKILFQRYFTHEIYNMIKEVDGNYINIDINFRFAWRGTISSVIGNTKLNDIYEYVVPYLYKGKEYNIFEKELFLIHLCCHFANEAWYFLLDVEYEGGDPCEIRLFRLLDICLLLEYVDMKKVWEIAAKMDCIEHMKYLGVVIRIVLGEDFASRYFSLSLTSARLNKYMNSEKKWMEWPVSFEERIFEPKIRNSIGELLYNK